MIRKYLPFLLLALCVLGVFLADRFLPKPVDWTPSLDGNDKRPLGLFVLKKEIPSLYPEGKFSTSYQTVYELMAADSLAGREPENLLLIAENLKLDKTDVRNLLARAQAGASILLSAHYFSPLLSDTLGFDWHRLSLFEQGRPVTDSLNVFISDTQRFAFPAHHLLTRLELPEEAVKLAEVPGEGAVLAVLPYGKGKFILNTTPYAFGNYYLLKPRYQLYIENLLRNLPPTSLHWTENYQLGRMESGSPLRYILKQPALKLAYYVLMGSLLVLLVLGSRRLQRAIPLIEHPQNTSRVFASTLGSLFYRTANHKALAEKRIQHLNDFLYRHYRLQPGQWTPAVLSRRTRLSEAKAEELVRQLQHIQHSPQLSAAQLLQFNTLLQSCYEHIRP